MALCTCSHLMSLLSVLNSKISIFNAFIYIYISFFASERNVATNLSYLLLPDNGTKFLA